jgi:hypothetical protein
MQNALTVPQRKALVGMLVTDHWGDCLWKTARNKYDGVRNSRKKELVRESSGSARTLLDELDSVGKKLETLEARRDELNGELSGLGFSLDSDGDLSVKSSSPLYRQIESELDGELGTFESVVTVPFKRAQAKLWTVATAEEADKLVEPFLSFEVKA